VLLEAAKLFVFLPCILSWVVSGSKRAADHPVKAIDRLAGLSSKKSMPLFVLVYLWSPHEASTL